MRLFNSVNQVQSYLSLCREKDNLLTVGFVPTMGALHLGHISLIEESIKTCSLTVCSIFVNPIQFNNKADLEKYPRTPEADLQLLESKGCDVVFMPGIEDIYPTENKEIFEFNGIDAVLEGKFRPGHFNGVAVVVKRLFEIIQPDMAFFGEKDFQQLTIIKHLVSTQNIPVQIIPCNTIREPDGLAMSSRNIRLNPGQRKNAPVIFQSLQWAKENFQKLSIAEIKEQVKNKIEFTPGMQLEYFEIVDSTNLIPINDASKNTINGRIACIAVFLGEIRLIDNIKI